MIVEVNAQSSNDPLIMKSMKQLRGYGNRTSPLVPRSGPCSALAPLLGAAILVSGCSKDTPERHQTSPAEARAAETSARDSKLELATASAKREQPPSGMCAEVCKHTVSLGCDDNDSECRNTCEQMLQVDVCAQEMARVFICMAKQPAEAFECGEDRIASLRDGHCDAEQFAFAECARAAAREAR